MIALADPRSFATVAGPGTPLPIVVIGIALIVGLGCYLWYAIALSKLFARLGEEGWKGWIPVLNEATILTLGGKPAWNAVLLFIPIVQLYGLYVKIVAVHRINRRFDRGAGLTVLAVLLPPAWATVLVVGPLPYPEGDRLAGIRPGPLRKPADAGSADSHEFLAPPILPPGSVAPPAPAYGGGGAVPGVSGAPAHASSSVVPPLAPPLEPASAAGAAAPAGRPPAPEPVGGSAPLIESVPWTSGQPGVTAPAPPPPAAAPGAPAPPAASIPPAAPAPAPAASAPAPAPAPPAASVPPAAPAPAAEAAPATPLVHPAPAAPAAPAAGSVPSDFATADTVDAPPAVLRTRGTASSFAPPADASSRSPVTRADLAAQVRPAPLTTPAPPAPAAAAEDDDEEFDATVVVSRRRGARRVLVLDDGRRFALSATSIVIGRNPEGQPGEQRLPIPDRTRTLSKTHARLVVQGDEWRLTDLQSTNGVVVVADDGAETLLDPGESVIGAGRFILGEVGMHVAVESAS
ncbi:DUF5684 domain-containing protein [Microbacterium sp. NPDC055312]